MAAGIVIAYKRVANECSLKEQIAEHANTKVGQFLEFRCIALMENRFLLYWVIFLEHLLNTQKITEVVKIFSLY